mgnify:CR=1 FL=1
MTFGEKVKEARLAMNLSQTELAQMTGISEDPFTPMNSREYSLEKIISENSLKLCIFPYPIFG